MFFLAYRPPGGVFGPVKIYRESGEVMVSIMASDMANGLPGTIFPRPGRGVHLCSLVLPGSAAPFHSSLKLAWDVTFPLDVRGQVFHLLEVI
jgi:hypothetical protein